MNKGLKVFVSYLVALGVFAQIAQPTISHEITKQIKHEERIKELSDNMTKVREQNIKTVNKWIEDSKKIAEEKRQEEIRKAQEEEEKRKIAEEKAKIEASYFNIIATGYTSSDADCGKSDGITASGFRASRGTIATPSDIPFGTVIEIKGMGSYKVLDRGGAIKRIDENTIKVDVWCPTQKQADDFGVKKLRGRIVSRPEKSIYKTR